jgi:predicted TPR repeat methyltransferase
MNNPWENIDIEDYENHMSLDSVFQLQTMNQMMKEQFYTYSIKSIMILGIAGGNGLEHINKQSFDKVYGIDINENYLNTCKKRYPELQDILETICVDLNQDTKQLPCADLIVANLLIEYIGYECFQKVVKKVNPRYVSCVIQVNTNDTFVSDSPYLHVFDRLDEVLHHVEENGIVDAMRKINYKKDKQQESKLPNGKKFVRIDFTR